MISTDKLTLSVNWVAERNGYRTQTSYFTQIVNESIWSMRANHIAYVFTEQQAQAVIAKAPFEVSVSRQEHCIALTRVKR